MSDLSFPQSNRVARHAPGHQALQLLVLLHLVHVMMTEGFRSLPALFSGAIGDRVRDLVGHAISTK